MTVLKYIVTVFCGYIFGSVSFSILISTLFHHRDIRKRGSGNAGATNMARSFGLSAGLQTMAGDMVKTALALLAGFFILGDAGICVSGIFCLLGHCFPVFYEFKGGKGVSAAAIIILFIQPVLFPFIIAIFLIAAILSHKVSVGSVCAALALVLSAFFVPLSIGRMILAVFTGLLVIIRHKENLKRLMQGTEPDFKIKSPGRQKSKKSSHK